MALNTDSLEFREHFLSGDTPGSAIPGLGLATVGSTGWSWEVAEFHDTIQRTVTSEPNHPGIVRLRARGQGLSAPGLGRLSMGNDNSTPIHVQNVQRFRSILRVVEPDADGDFTDEGVFTGLGSAPAFYFGGSDLGGDCIFFSFRPSASPKWQAGCQVMDMNTFTATQTMITSSGPDIALDTWYVLEAVQLTPGEWEFFVDGTSMGTVNTNVPDMPLTPQYRILTQMQHATGYNIQVDCDEFAYRLGMSGIPGIAGW